MLGPIVTVSSSRLEFDTVFCRVKKCASVTFTNSGDTVSHFYQVTGITQPFSSDLANAFDLQPKASRTFRFCYEPPNAPRRDSLTLTYSIDTRPSMSYAFLFDVSASMNYEDVFDSASRADVTRLAAARAAVESYLVSLKNEPPAFTDEAMLAQFAAAAEYQVLGDFTEDALSMIPLLPTEANGSGTCLYDAVIRTAAALEQRSQERLLIVVTDGNNTCALPPSVDDAVAACRAAKVRVMIFGIGDVAPDELKYLCSSTNGSLFLASNTTALVRAFKQVLVIMSGKQQRTITMHARGVTPDLALDPPAIDFGEVTPGQTRCSTCVVRNTGDAPFVLTDVSSVQPPFTVQRRGLDSVRVCYAPKNLTNASASITIKHNSCRNADLSLTLAGVPTDVATLVCIDSLRAKPGTIVHLPIYIDTKIPTEYAIESCDFSLSYNKSMLDPLPQPFVPNGGAAHAFATKSFSTAFTDTRATTTFSFRDGRLVTAGGRTTLASIAFLALHGDALSTDITLSGVSFGTPNLKTSITQRARFTADSLCNHEARLIRVRQGNAMVVQQNAPNPVTREIGRTEIRFALTHDAWTTVTLFDAFGRRVEEVMNEWKPSGDHAVTIQTHALGSGVYFYRITAGGQSETKKLIVQND